MQLLCGLAILKEQTISFQVLCNVYIRDPLTGAERRVADSIDIDYLNIRHWREFAQLLEKSDGWFDILEFRKCVNKVL